MSFYKCQDLVSSLSEYLKLTFILIIVEYES